MTDVLIKPRRSVLYMPGSNQRALTKARELPADALIFDLEDAVAPAAKETARQQVCAALQGDYGSREVAVRINPLDNDWGKADAIALATLRPHAVVLPKVESAEQIDALAQLLQQRGAEDCELWAMIETPLGVLNVTAIAACSRLTVLIMGTSDLANEMRLPSDPERLGFIPLLSQCVLAARAHGCDVLDGVHLDISDAEGLRADCEQGKALGFDGKTLIHPNQLAIANEVFAPARVDVGHAHKVIAAWKRAQQESKGVAVVDGKLVENLHVAQAQRVLALQDAIAQRQSSK
ncbi:MAG: HpcH/HpaI aldolase/citrate lyase family protein [Pseudomonadales bacterium]